MNCEILSDTKVIIKVASETSQTKKDFEYFYQLTSEQDFLIEVLFEEKPLSVEVSFSTSLFLGWEEQKGGEEKKKIMKNFKSERNFKSVAKDNGDFNQIYLKNDSSKGYEVLVITKDGTLRKEIPLEITL